MAKRKGFKIFGWILIGIGLLGVVVPHVAFIANLIPTLSTISHASFELVSAAFILVGALILGMGKR